MPLLGKPPLRMRRLEVFLSIRAQYRLRLHINFQHYKNTCCTAVYYKPLPLMTSQYLTGRVCV